MRTLSWLAVVLSLCAALFTPAPVAQAQAVPNVVISEIHYHPQAVGTSFPDFDDREDTEFIEIVNLENTSVDVSGWCLDDAVEYCFSAGTSVAPMTAVVIAHNGAAFDELFGFVPFAVYDGKLSNSGERVVLADDSDVAVVDITWATADPWPVTPDGKGPSLELTTALGDTASPANWQASASTNGSPGSVPTLSNAVPPLVLSHTGAEIVATGQSIPVTATAANTSTMRLVYNVNFGNNQTINMSQNGGTWQATLPALSNGGFIQYRFEATGPGGTTVSPRPDDVVDWWAVGVASQQQSPGVPVLDLFISPQNWTDIEGRNCPCFGAVAYDGNIWTNVSIRRAGLTSVNQAKGHLRLDFPAGSPFVAEFLDGPVDELTLDAGYPNYELIREQFSWDLVEQVGFPAIRNQHVRVHRGGSFHGLFLLREEQDGNWRARHDLDRGAFYKIDQFNATISNPSALAKKEGLDEPDTDLLALASCVNSSGNALRTCLNETTDVPQLINEFAAMVMVWQTDQREFNYFLYRDNSQNMLWRMLPDDMDRSWGNHSGGSNPINLDPSSGKVYRRCVGTDPTPANEICRAFMNVPEFKEMYLRRIRTLTDEVLADPQWHTKLATVSDLIADDWQDDDDRWNRTPYSLDQMVTAMDQWIDDYVAHLRAGGHEGNVPDAQSNAPQISITGFRSDPGDGLGYVLLTNPSASESVDLSNWTLDGLAEIPPGLVVLPGATVAVSTNDQAFRAMNPSFMGVRATTDGAISGLVTLVRRDGSTAATIGQASPAPIVLNEWNAVSSDNTLPGGDATLGSIVGNGGDWFELVVVDDDLDVRGWSLVMSDNDSGVQEVTDEFVFTNDPLLAELEGGTIITISEDFADDVTFLPAFGDWHINLQSNSQDEGAYFTASSQSNFATNHKNWQLSIFDAAGNLVFGPAGEGIGAATGINSSEIGELEADPSSSVSPLTDFGDGEMSTFGLPNESEGAAQDFSSLRYPYVGMDVDCTGAIDIGDALRIAQYSVGLLSDSNQCPLANPAQQIYVGAADVDRNNFIDIGDALLVAQCTVGLINEACP